MRLIKKFLSVELINSIVRILLRPISVLLPEKIKVYIPVIGKISVKLPDGNFVILWAKGDSVSSSLFWKGFKGYEYETMKIFYAIAKKSKVIFDIGAERGYYSIIACIANKRSRVFAFEPLPSAFRWLKHNVELNHLNNVVLIPSAVTNFDGEITLYIPKGSYPTEASTLKGFRVAQTELRVAAIRLDSYVKEHSIDKIDLIKIDTEATEHLVLEGMQHIIKRDEPIIICEVLARRTEEFLQNFLTEYGYKFYWVTNEGLVRKEKIEGDTHYKYRNYLFCKDSANSLLLDISLLSVPI